MLTAIFPLMLADVFDELEQKKRNRVSLHRIEALARRLFDCKDGHSPFCV